MIRIILRGSYQITEENGQVFYKTVDIDSPELEKAMKAAEIVGGEIVKEKEIENK